MAQGRIVFDGAPEMLDEAAVQDIYGAGEHNLVVDEGITSTSIRVAGAMPSFARA
jgi:phosphonate transport system ATP-binding protein